MPPPARAGVTGPTKRVVVSAATPPRQRGLPVLARTVPRTDPEPMCTHGRQSNKAQRTLTPSLSPQAKGRVGEGFAFRVSHPSSDHIPPASHQTTPNHANKSHVTAPSPAPTSTPKMCGFARTNPAESPPTPNPSPAPTHPRKFPIAAPMDTVANTPGLTVSSGIARLRRGGQCCADHTRRDVITARDSAAATRRPTFMAIAIH